MKEHTKNSKFLSLVLRHQPEKIGLSLDENGWAKVEDLLEKLPFELDFDSLKYIVDSSDKQRFAFSDDFTMIRANQGHSIKVDLQLIAIQPPEILYHGTPAQNIASIKGQGLHKGKRHHVHLSADVETAARVGNRRGRAVVLKIKAGEMHRQGIDFYISNNRVWLTEAVPTEFIVFEENNN
ncbi:MAG: RNA 2'-phosphotransferase [Saprospiraceae bacterium]